MRDITRDFDSIYAAQKYLNKLHYSSGGEIPLVHPDGIFGAETTAAVKKFQELYGLPVTGDIDLATWNALYQSYLLAEKESARPEPLRVYPDTPGYELTPNERSDITAIVQFVLRLLADVHTGIEGKPPTGVYDPDTMKDITEFQRIHGLPQTGIVDRRTWDALAEAYDRANK